MAPEATSNCLHSSNHLSLFISPFPHLLIHQAIIISLSLQSHPSLSFSITQPHFLLIFCLPLSLPMIPSAFCASVCLFSSLTFFPELCCQLPVIANCDFFCCCCCSCRILCFFQCHPAGRPPHQLLLKGVGTLDKCMYEICKCARMVPSAGSISVIIFIRMGSLPGEV